MRPTDIVRQVLDLLDTIEGPHDLKPEVKIDVQQHDEPDNRFKHILAMLDPDSFSGIANSPNEVVAPISAVTTDAGGGYNGPKDPADIRVKDPSMHHNQQEY
jgi:hypothetical protein